MEAERKSHLTQPVQQPRTDEKKVMITFEEY